MVRQLHGLSLDGADNKTLLTYSTRSNKIILLVSVICAVLGGILNLLIPVGYFPSTLEHRTMFATDIHDNKPGHLRSNCWCIPKGHILINSSTRFEHATPACHLHTILGLPINCHLRSHLHHHDRFLLHWERNTRALRKEYLKSVFRLNIAYFDIHEPGQVSSRIMSDMTHVQEGLTSKVSIALMAVVTFGVSFVISFVLHWKTALILRPTLFIMTAIGYTSG